MIEQSTIATSRHTSLISKNVARRAFAIFDDEDIFVAVGSILLIKGFMEQSGLTVQPFDLSVWAIPTALCALAVHGARLLLLDRRIARHAAENPDKRTAVTRACGLTH